MDSQGHELHIFFLPFMAQGQIIPMIDIARVLAKRGVMASIVTTPINAARFQTIIDREKDSGNQIQFLLLRFPCTEAGLPAGCENIDLLPSPKMALSFYMATEMLQQPFEHLVQKHLPDAIVSDMYFPWTAKIASNFEIPRLIFNGTCCFSLSVSYAIRLHKPHQNIDSNFEHFVVPGLPDHIEITKAQLPESTMTRPDANDFFKEVEKAEALTYGLVINSFNELENAYVEYYKEVTGKPTWLIGPVSLCSKEHIDKAERGNKASVDRDWCLSWLDSKEPGSVVYVCFGSACHFSKSQLLELGLGLEASNVPFIWVIRGGEVDEWLPSGFEERLEGRGLIVRGWAPQILILSHWAVGGFMTHCGWNSILECISVGLPMITWPLFVEQFLNEKLVVQVLRIGIGIGVEDGVKWGEEDKARLIKREVIEKVVARFMDLGEENKEMRKRAKRFGDMAKWAIENEGSSYHNLSLLIEELKQNKSTKERALF